MIAAGIILHAALIALAIMLALLVGFFVGAIQALEYLSEHPEELRKKAALTGEGP